MSNECTNENTSCKYMEPHEHGFACDATCVVCGTSPERPGASFGFTDNRKTHFVSGRQYGKTAALKAATEAAVEAQERQRIRELLRDDKVQEGIRGMQGMALELSQGAIRDPKVMQQWKEMFPDICPGCFGLHSRMIPYLKGLCTGCRLKLSKAQKQL